MAIPQPSSDVTGLEPARLWRFFSEISAIPRPSKREDRIGHYIRATAENQGFKVHVDQIGNVVIDVPASPGCDGAPVTVLQAHLDMVGEKNTGTVHDFDQDPIRLIVENQPADGELIVRADGTTLGADNGIGVALGLAVAFSPEVIHGPLELLFTVDEEAGMSGAKALDPGFFRGRRLLNLDSEEDDRLYIGCSGGCDTVLSWDFDLERLGPGVVPVRVAVRGLRGGHSGGDIHENRANAIKLLARVLARAADDQLTISSIAGGSVRNAIPREATAIVAGGPGLSAALSSAAAEVRGEAAIESDEPTAEIQVEPVAGAEVPGVIPVADAKRLLDALAALPCGVLGMHRSVSGLVETSNNVATAATALGEGKIKVEVCTMARSSSTSRLSETLTQIAAVGELAGAEATAGNGYPGWDPNPDSPLLGTCRRVYEKLYGESPTVAAIHAGLECGIIGERIAGMDMVSLGPRTIAVHSPDEHVYVSSVAKSWEFLCAVLTELANE